MRIDENTKYLARIHTKANARGLNIYNPYFEEMGVNAIYSLFFNNTPDKLLDACMKLGYVALNTAGFESDPEFAKLVDEFDHSSELVGHVGYLKNENGKWKAYYQGGEGLLAALLQKFHITDQEIVIVGAGNVATSLIDTMRIHSLKPKKLTLVNRTIAKAKELASRLELIDEVRSIEELPSLKGDILINCTHIGGRDEDNIYTKEVLSNFKGVGDVTFEIESPHIIEVAKSLSIPYSSGWDFFTFQGKVFLENALGIEVDPLVLRKHVENGLRSVI
jgi:shikimate 5-dehydrogenase